MGFSCTTTASNAEDPLSSLLFSSWNRVRPLPPLRGPRPPLGLHLGLAGPLASGGGGRLGPGECRGE